MTSCVSFTEKTQCVLDKVDESLRLGIPSSFEKLLNTIERYGKRKKKHDLIQLAKKIRADVEEELERGKPARPSYKPKSSQTEPDLNEAYSKLIMLIPSLLADDILPEHLKEEVTAISTAKQQAKFLLDRMLPDMSASDVENFLNVMDKYSKYERNSVSQMELIFDSVK